MKSIYCKPCYGDMVSSDFRIEMVFGELEWKMQRVELISHFFYPLVISFCVTLEKLKGTIFIEIVWRECDDSIRVEEQTCEVNCRGLVFSSNFPKDQRSTILVDGENLKYVCLIRKLEK